MKLFLRLDQGFEDEATTKCNLYRIISQGTKHHDLSQLMLTLMTSVRWYMSGFSTVLFGKKFHLRSRGVVLQLPEGTAWINYLESFYTGDPSTFCLLSQLFMSLSHYEHPFYTSGYNPGVCYCSGVQALAIETPDIFPSFSSFWLFEIFHTHLIYFLPCS